MRSFILKEVCTDFNHPFSISSWVYVYMEDIIFKLNIFFSHKRIFSAMTSLIISLTFETWFVYVYFQKNMNIKK